MSLEFNEAVALEIYRTAEGISVNDLEKLTGTKSPSPSSKEAFAYWWAFGMGVYCRRRCDEFVLGFRAGER